LIYIQHFLKNIEFSKVIELKSTVSYMPGQVVSKTLAQGAPISITLFAFDKGEEISSHESKGDAMVLILDGEAQITVGDEKFVLKEGQTIVMPANVPHALFASQQFKMMLVVVFKLDS
jgi:quercetin dioxygenase-like cupin family protein